MDPKSQVEAAIRAALAKVAPDQAGVHVLVERPKQAGHGDFSTNIALQLAKTLKDMHSSQELMQNSMNSMVLGLQAAVESMGNQGVEAGGKIAARRQHPHRQRRPRPLPGVLRPGDRHRVELVRGRFDARRRQLLVLKKVESLELRV